MTGELPEALELLRGGQTAWEQLGRPLDAAPLRVACSGSARADTNEILAEEALAGSAAAAYERLGVSHLAARARELMAA